MISGSIKDINWRPIIAVIGLGVVLFFALYFFLWWLFRDFNLSYGYDEEPAVSDNPRLSASGSGK